MHLQKSVVLLPVLAPSRRAIVGPSCSEQQEAAGGAASRSQRVRRGSMSFPLLLIVLPFLLASPHCGPAMPVTVLLCRML